MLCKKIKNNEFEYEIFKNVNQVPKEIFETEKWINDKYLSVKFLESIEETNKDLEFLYVLIKKEQEILLFASIQISKIQFKENIKNECAIMNEITKLVSKYSKNHPFYLIVCGNIFISGEHGFKQKNKTDKLLETLILSIEKNNKTKNNKTVHAILFKDYYNEIPVLKKIGFRPFQTEPTLIVDINSTWQSFDDYLMAMKAKYRTKAKKTFKESSILTVRDFSSSEIEQYFPVLNDLYINVEKKSLFSLGKLDLHAYINLKKEFTEDFILQSYWLDDKMVGFMSAMVNNDSLDAHYVGIDYEYNRKYYIYQRILYDYVKIAIDKKLLKVNLGRTATEIKTTIGAKPVELICYVKHSCIVSNSILKPLTQSVKLPEFKSIKPFK